MLRSRRTATSCVLPSRPLRFSTAGRPV